MPLDRMTAQLMAEKLDRNLVSLAETKEFARKNYGVILKGRTKEQVAREVIRAANKEA